jgi:hypothetical protein
MTPPDRTPLEERPTWRPDAPPGTPPCMHLGCGCGPVQRPCVPGTDRCEHHQHTSRTVQMRAALLDVFLEASAGAAE